MIRVMASSVIGAPVEKVWELLRDFGRVAEWLPGVASSVIDVGGAPDKIGSTRALTFADGGKMRERLLALSDPEHAVTFAIIESELPIENYQSTIQLQPITDGEQSYITWRGEFDVTDSGQEEKMKRRMREDIYQAGFDALKKRFVANGNERSVFNP